MLALLLLACHPPADSGTSTEPPTGTGATSTGDPGTTTTPGTGTSSGISGTTALPPGPGTLWILSGAKLMAGDGFAHPIATVHGSGGYASYLGLNLGTVGDLDGDGLDDLVFCDQDRVVLLPGAQAAGVVDPSSLATLQTGCAQHVLMWLFFPGDVTGDGLADVVVAHEVGDAQVISGADLGGDPVATLHSANPFQMFEATPGDVDGNGVDDLLVYDPPLGTWVIVRGPLAGTVDLDAQTWTFDPTVYPQAIGDVDGDGRGDLGAERQYDHAEHVLLASTLPSVGPIDLATSTASMHGTYGVGNGLRRFGDLDGDGRAELVTSDSVVFPYAAGNRGPADATWSFPDAYAGFTGDFDGDGTPDALFFWAWFTGFSDPAPGTWTRSDATFLVQQSNDDCGTALDVGDLDGDGADDVALSLPCSP